MLLGGNGPGSGSNGIMWRLASWLCLLGPTLATPLHPTFSSCLNSYLPQAPEAARLRVNDVYANIVPEQEASEEGLQGNGVQVLRINLIGETDSELVGYDNATNKLATLFIDAEAASFNVYQSTSWVCNSLFPDELPGPYYPSNTTYCPIPAGPFGLNISIPLYRSYALTTIRTQIRVVDTSEVAQTLSCIDLQFTPYHEDGWYYGFFLWLPVALAIGFFVTTWSARFAAGWVVGSGVAEYEQKETALSRGAKLDGAKKEARMRKWGTMIISGLSGERLSVSGGLLRFVTPGLKEVIHHVQFCAILGMIAVAWPRFAYPVLSQGAWATMVWNTTLVQGSNAGSKRVSPYPDPDNYTAPAEFADQISDPNLPLYLDESAFNPLLNLYNQHSGMESFAFAVGLRPQDLFGTCLVIFLIIVLAVVLISLALWAAHCLIEYLGPTSSSKQQSHAASRPSLGPTPTPSYGTKDLYEPRTPSLWDTSAPPSLPSQHNVPHPTGPSHARRIWWRFRPKGEAGAFHAAALYGNLLRLILMFHLPITVFSIYQLVLGSRATIVSRVFAALAFAFISVLVPAGIMFKIKRTASGKLFDATRTLLSLGPMYNVYVEDKQMYRAVPLGASLVVGIVVGAGQGSGLAQAIILVMVELSLLIAPAVWYPWDEGASMGASHTFVAALRTISMVLVMLLSPQLGMTPFTVQWLAYAVLLLQAIIFVFYLLMLITKAVEGFIRLFGGVHFDESTHPLDGGLFGAIADLDCLNPKGGKAAQRKRRKRGSKQLQRNVSAAGSLTTQMMLDRHSMGVMRPAEGGGSTPFLSPPSHGRPEQTNYFPAYAPPLGPPPMERHSSDSRSDEPYHGGMIMDAWRPHPQQPPPQPMQGSYFGVPPSSPPGTYPDLSSDTHGRSQPTPNPYGPNAGFAVIRGGRADANSPYAVRPDTAADRSATMSPPPSVRVSPISPKPGHSRQHSSSAIIENYESRTSPPHSPLYPPAPPAGMRRQTGGIKPNTHGLIPPALTIPKRRSLNNLREDSPTSQNDKKKKRRSWFKGDSSTPDRNGNDNDTEESDDEPGPSRRRQGGNKGKRRSSIPLKEPAPFEPVPLVLDDEDDRPAHAPSARGGGLLGLLGLRKKKSLDDVAEQARDENKARKAALAAESGAMLFGVQPAPAEQRSFKVARRDDKLKPGPTSPAAAGPSSRQPQGQGEPRSFKVKRVNHNVPTPTESPTRPIELDTTSGSGGGKSFKVIRPSMPHASASGASSTHTGSFVVNRPPSHTPSPAPGTPPLRPTTPQHTSPEGLVSPTKQGKASMFRSPPKAT